jgi:effector-binding domain-containing protein
MDTTATVEYFGNDGTVGSGFKWKGKKAGKGEQTYTVLEPGRTATTHLKFYVPWGTSETDSYMNLEPDPKGTKLTWGIKGENDFMGRMMGAMSSMDKMMGPVFEEGLHDLDTLIATRKSAVPTSSTGIETTNYPGGKYLAVRGDVKMEDIENFYMKNLPAIMNAIEKSGGKMKGMPSGLYFTWDPDNSMTNMAAAIGVEGDVKAPSGTEVITVDPSKALMIKYMGGYHGIGNAHMAMESHLKANNLTQKAPVIEEYVTDPGTEPDSNKWVTTITYLIN